MNTKESPTHGVVEIFGDGPCVTTFTTAEAAEDFAVKLALENTDCTEEEARTNLKAFSHHKMADWSVYLCNVHLHESTTQSA